MNSPNPQGFPQLITRFVDRLLNRRKGGASDPAKMSAAAGTAVSQPPARRVGQTYRASEQGLSTDSVPQSAMRTCQVLQQAGYRAYIVGGGVRDSLLGLKPKDFDVATDATPEQVIKLFRRSRLIGRRFQIVHVMFGRDMIEVSTFRALQENAQTDAHGRVLHDNVWGTIEEDSARRDFTVNALYYDPIGDTLIDYHDGVRDMKQRTLRMIGDPETRYREDPVRMLRTARFAAKLGFAIEPATAQPIARLADLIHNVPPARLFDEILKLLTSGHALQSLHQLRVQGLHHGLLPLLDVIIGQADGERFITAALTRTDERVMAGKPISPGFLFATLLWQQVLVRWRQRTSAGEHTIPALMTAIDSVVDEQCEKMAIQKRIAADMREIWSLQPRFERRNGRSPLRLLEHLRFRAGYDFLLLRVEAGEADQELGDWWTAFVDADHDHREQLLSQVPASGGAGARKRRRRKPRADNPSADASRGPQAGESRADSERTDVTPPRRNDSARSDSQRNDPARNDAARDNTSAADDSGRAPRGDW